MPGVKGRTNNPNGRPKGVINKFAEDMRKNVLLYLYENFNELKTRMQSLAPNEYVRAYIDLMKYGLYPAQPPEKKDDNKKKDDELVNRIIEASKS